MNRKRTILAAALFLVLIVICCRLMFWESSQTLRLADGREVAIKMVSYGREHRYVQAPSWKRALAPLVSTNWAARLGIKKFSTTTAHETLSVWLEWRGLTNSQPRSSISIVSMDGLESDRVPLDQAINAGAGTYLENYTVFNFPRRSKEFVVRVYETANPREGKPPWVVVGNLKLQNPARGPWPRWTAEPLPAFKNAQGAAFALRGFNTGLSATGVVANSGASWTEIFFYAGSNASPELASLFMLMDWTVEDIQLTDATGNIIRQGGLLGRISFQNDQQYGMRLNDGGFLLRGCVWPEETWRIEMQFVRDFDSLHRDAPHWVAKDIPLPTDGSYQPIDQQGELEGSVIHLVGIAAKGVALPRWGMARASNPRLYVRFAPPTQAESFRRSAGAPSWSKYYEETALESLHNVTLTKTIDQRGSNVVTKIARAGEDSIIVELLHAAESKTLDFAFAHDPKPMLQFTAQPTLLRTNVARFARSELREPTRPGL